MDRLMKRSDELHNLINRANTSLNIPVSTVRVDIERSLSNLKPKIAMDLQRCITKGRPKEILVDVVVLGVAYLGATVYDAARNGWAHHEAKNALMGYYQELASKQNMIIEELNRVTAEYAQCAAQNSAEAVRLKKRCEELEMLSKRILAFLKDVSG